MVRIRILSLSVRMREQKYTYNIRKVYARRFTLSAAAHQQFLR